MDGLYDQGYINYKIRTITYEAYNSVVSDPVCLADQTQVQ